MLPSGKSARFAIPAAAAGLLAVGLWVAPFPTIAQTNAPIAQLVPHRAVYDLKLVRAQGKRSMESVRGRILYDFSGSACEGYALQFRQVSQLDTGEGKAAVSDLRSTTWEDGEAKTYRFNSQNRINERLIDNVDGRAERKGGELAISLSHPQQKSFALDDGFVFPTQHMRKILEAAHAGKSLLQVDVYDGSETGEKIYETLTVIGKEIPPDERKPADAAATTPALAGLKRWPVTISYFDKRAAKGEQTPIYAITFELYANGISRALTLDYGDLVISGELASLDVQEPKPCP